MGLELLEVTEPSLAYTVLGGFVVAFSMMSLLVKEKLYINEVVLGTAFGVLMGPHCANVFDPRSWGSQSTTITLEVMRVVLATGLFAIGVELPQSYLADHAKGLLVMVVPTMAFGWVIVAAVIKALFPAYNFVSALAVAACLTPTDPIICAAIVGGKFAIKHVPTNLRRILAAESAANDGLAYPFLSISIYLTVESSRKVAIGKWFLVGWLYQVILGIVLGAFLGIAFCYLMKYSHRKGFIDRESYIAQFIALTLLTIGVASTLGSDDLLAAFAAGSAISWDGHFNIQIENAVFSSVIDLVLNCGCFIYIGAWLPFDAFNSPQLGIEPWRLLILFFAILLLRRIPALLLLYKWVPEINGWKEALFSGHFGPMGVGAVFISTLALTRLPEPQSPPQGQPEYLAATLQPIVAFIVLGSILIHGLSIPFFSFGRRIHSRTVSMSRTWTSRQPLTPDWLNWVRREPPTLDNPSQNPIREVDATDLERGAPAGTSGSSLDHKGVGTDDVELVDGLPKDKSLDAVVVTEQEASSSGFNTPGHLGEAGIVEDHASAKMRRCGFESSEHEDTTGKKPDVKETDTPRVRTPVQLQVVIENKNKDQARNGPDPILVSQELTKVKSGSIPTRVQIVETEGEGKTPSGSQTPNRLVHFPADQ